MPQVELESIGSSNAAVVCGPHHTVVLRVVGTVHSTGQNDYGQLGDGTTQDRSTPVRARGLSFVVAVSAGRAHTVYLVAGGRVFAAGNNAYGQLGDGSTVTRLAPVEVFGAGADNAAVSAGVEHTVFLKVNGTVWNTGRANYQAPVASGNASGDVRANAESAWRMWGLHSCQQMQDGWQVCTDDTDPNHATVMANCPYTCAIARGDVTNYTLVPVERAERGSMNTAVVAVGSRTMFLELCSCTAVACPGNSTGTDVPTQDCVCDAGYSNLECDVPSWLVSSGSGSGSEYSNDGDGCRTGTINAEYTDPYYSGGCEPVPCPTNSTGTDIITGDCVCDPGYFGSIVPAIGDPYYAGGCTLAACPTNTYGSGVVAGCGCVAGYNGTLGEASRTPPYFAGLHSHVFSAGAFCF